MWLTPQIKDLWTYEKARRKGKRRSKWIWTAAIEIEGEGIKYIYEVGDRGEETLMRLMEKLPDSEEYETDGYVVYENIDRRKHKVKKYGRVNRNEGLHSRLRDKLGSLRRKGKGYSKSERSLEIYLALIFIYWGFI
jgi:insertion element IS1 protein InsB